MVINAIPSGIFQLLKGQFRRQETEKVDFTLFISDINIMSHRCNNKHIRNHFFKIRKITPIENLYGLLISLILIGKQHGSFHINLSPTKLKKFNIKLYITFIPQIYTNQDL